MKKCSQLASGRRRSNFCTRSRPQGVKLKINLLHDESGKARFYLFAQFAHLDPECMSLFRLDVLLPMIIAKRCSCKSCIRVFEEEKKKQSRNIPIYFSWRIFRNENPILLLPSSYLVAKCNFFVNRALSARAQHAPLCTLAVNSQKSWYLKFVLHKRAKVLRKLRQKFFVHFHLFYI